MPFEQLLSRWRLSPTAIISASLALAVVAIAAFVAVFAGIHDADQRKIEERIIGSAAKDSLNKLADALAPNTYWDIAYDQIGERIDLEWAKNNLGPYAAATSRVAAVFVFGVGSVPKYEYYTDSQHAFLAADTPGRRAILALVERAAGDTGVPPVLATGFVQLGDSVYLAAASRIVPSDERAKSELTRKNVEVYLREFDASSIAKVQDDFGVSDVMLSTEAPTGKLARIALHDVTGIDVAYLSWRPATPGQRFALLVLPFALIVICIIGLLQIVALGGWKAATASLEFKKRESDRLREESWGKTMFLANMSHELRTPLNAIIGFSEIMQTQLVGEVAPRYRDYAKDIHDSGVHLLNIVNDVLDLTKLQNSDRLDLAPLGICAAIETGLKILRIQAERSSIALDVERDPRDVFVNANEKALNQIVVNLGSNAIKFSEPGKRVHLTIKEHAGRAEIAVTDQGCGIPASKLPMLGQPFYQAQSSYSRKPGVGLGLAITKVLVGKLAGEINIASQVGIGTTVTVTLPICETRAVELATAGQRFEARKAG